MSRVALETSLKEEEYSQDMIDTIIDSIKSQKIFKDEEEEFLCYAVSNQIHTKGISSVIVNGTLSATIISNVQKTIENNKSIELQNKDSAEFNNIIMNEKNLKDANILKESLNNLLLNEYVNIADSKFDSLSEEDQNIISDDMRNSLFTTETANLYGLIDDFKRTGNTAILDEIYKVLPKTSKEISTPFIKNGKIDLEKINNLDLNREQNKFYAILKFESKGTNITNFKQFEENVERDIQQIENLDTKILFRSLLHDFKQKHKEKSMDEISEVLSKSNNEKTAEFFDEIENDSLQLLRKIDFSDLNNLKGQLDDFYKISPDLLKKFISFDSISLLQGDDAKKIIEDFVKENEIVIEKYDNHILNNDPNLILTQDLTGQIFDFDMPLVLDDFELSFDEEQSVQEEGITQEEILTFIDEHKNNEEIVGTIEFSQEQDRGENTVDINATSEYIEPDKTQNKFEQDMRAETFTPEEELKLESEQEQNEIPSTAGIDEDIEQKDIGGPDNSDYQSEVEENALKKFAKGILKNIARIPIVGNLVKNTKVLNAQKTLGDGGIEIGGNFNPPLSMKIRDVAIRAGKGFMNLGNNIRNLMSPNKEENEEITNEYYTNPISQKQNTMPQEDKEMADSSKPNVTQEMSEFDRRLKVNLDNQPIIPVGVTSRLDNEEKDINGEEDKPKPNKDEGHEEL